MGQNVQHPNPISPSITPKHYTQIRHPVNTVVVARDGSTLKAGTELEYETCVSRYTPPEMIRSHEDSMHAANDSLSHSQKKPYHLITN